jgi:hypothetical protein
MKLLSLAYQKTHPIVVGSFQVLPEVKDLNKAAAPEQEISFACGRLW